MTTNKHNTIDVLIMLAFAGMVAALLCGCVMKGAVNSQTSTVFGAQIDQNQNGVPTVKIGLIRTEWHIVPVSSNSTAPDVLAVTDAELRPLGADRVHRVFSVGDKAVSAAKELKWFPAEPTNTTTAKP